MENQKVAFGETHEIVAHKKHKGLIGRLMVVTKESKKPGMVNGFLFHEKTGLPQKVEIAIDHDCLKVVLKPVVIQVEEVKEEVAKPATPKKSRSKKEKVQATA